MARTKQTARKCTGGKLAPRKLTGVGSSQPKKRTTKRGANALKYVLKAVPLLLYRLHTLLCCQMPKTWWLYSC